MINLSRFEQFKHDLNKVLEKHYPNTDWEWEDYDKDWSDVDINSKDKHWRLVRLFLNVEHEDTNKVIFTKKELWANQIPLFDFEYNEDQLLEKALEVGFVTKIGEDQYEMNEDYLGKRDERRT